MSSRITVFKWALFLSGSLFLYLGLSEPIIRIAVSLETVVLDAVDQNPILGILLQQNGFDIQSLIKLLPADQYTDQSIISSVSELYRAGSFLAATIILIFSVIFPILKQAVILIKLLKINSLPDPVLQLTSRIHKWAMIDVFVVSSVVITLSNASGWTATLQAGLYWFIAYFFTTAILMHFTKTRPVTHTEKAPS